MKKFAYCCLLLGVLLPLDLTAQKDRELTMYELWGIGKSYFDKGEYRNAVEYFVDVINMDPSFVEAYEYKGHALFWLRDYEGAILDFNEAIRYFEDKLKNEPKIGREVPHDLLLITHTEYDDKLEQLYNNRGTAYYEIGDYAASYLDFEQVLAYNPSSQEGKYNIDLAKRTLNSRNIPIPGTQPKDKLFDRIFANKIEYSSVKGHSTYENLIISRVELTRSSTLVHLQLYNEPSPENAPIFIKADPKSREAFYLQGENVRYNLKKAYDAANKLEEKSFKVLPGDKFSFILEFDRIPENVDLIHLIEGSVSPVRAFNIYDIQLQ